MITFVIGGGCFWCLDAIYRRIQGVISVESGYAGGDGPRPTYYQVAMGRTGYAEVVRLTFDESIIPAETILGIFFVSHDPTTLNRQGADIGTQYRSVMLYESDEQQHLYDAAITTAQRLWDEPVVTEVKPLNAFFPAEEEHQDYFNKHPEAGYCQVVIQPKLRKAREQFTSWFKKEDE